MGVTADLLELWENQGGHDFSQLVDWLYQLAGQTSQSDSVKVSRTGPVVIIQTEDEEYVATFQVCYNQANRASALGTFWTTDGDVTYHRMAGTNSDWPRFWSTFLGLLPSDVALAVARLENKVRY